MSEARAHRQALPVGVIDHVAVAVHDVAAAIATYTDLLGYRVVVDEVVDAAGVRLVHLAPTAPDAGAVPTTLQLVAPQPGYAPGPVAAHLLAHGEGLHHVCLVTPDITAALRAAGHPDDGAVFRGGRGRPCAFLDRRPHGVLVELMEVPSGTTPTTEEG